MCIYIYMYTHTHTMENSVKYIYKSVSSGKGKMQK